MKRILGCLVLITCLMYGMETQEQRPKIKHSWEGSGEQWLCFWWGCVSVSALEAYIGMRITPSEQYPVYKGFWGEHELRPEYEQCLGLIPVIAVLLSATNEKPDHSCCCGKTRITVRALGDAYKKLATLCWANNNNAREVQIGHYDDIPVIPMVMVPNGNAGDSTEVSKSKKHD